VTNEEFKDWFAREVTRRLEALGDEERGLLVELLERNLEVKEAAVEEAEREATVAWATLERVRKGMYAGPAPLWELGDYASTLMQRRSMTDHLSKMDLSPEASADEEGLREFGPEDWVRLWAVEALCRKLDPEAGL